MKFSVSSKALTSQSDIADVFTCFFVDNYPVGFRMDKECDTWKDLDAQDRRRLRDLFHIVKRGVRAMLMHADTYPEKRLKPFERCLFNHCVLGVKAHLLAFSLVKTMRDGNFTV